MSSKPPPDEPQSGAAATGPNGVAPSAREHQEPARQPATDNDPNSAPNPAQTFPARLSLPVVGIGASAGGLEALEALIQRLSADRMAFVVVQHLAPGHVSMLTDILARGTKLRVVTVEHGMHLEPATIYVAPPTVELSLEGEDLHVTSTADVRGPRRSIDAFLRSLARAGGPGAIGVVLSGSGSDGTLGLKAIKDEGGITFVQDPSTAAQPSMPQSALDAGCADFALSPGEIGDELMRLSAHPYVGRSDPGKLLERDATLKIFAQLRITYGVDFGLYKQSTVERRIGRRMALHKLQKVEDYLAFLAADPNELGSLYNDLLIGVTSFFRDAEPFDALKNVVFPRLFAERSTDVPIRMWVAGCATGEEAYSVAIALLEFLGPRASAFKIQIFATDLDEDALSRARVGVYPSSIELDVAPERLLRFFAKIDRGYQVARQVRDLIVFARHNLGKDPPFSRLDVITCRNVLIYMQMPLQRKVLRIFHYALNFDSYLLLGTSESVGDAADLFSLLDRKLKVYAKKNAPATAVFDFAFSGRLLHDEDNGERPADPRPVIGVAQIADRKVIEKYGPPGVIVDEKLDILQFRGKTGPYLEPAPGAATLNLLKLARPELVVLLRSTLPIALSEGLPSASPPVPLWSDHGPRSVAVDVLPLAHAAGRKCLLILFKEISQTPKGAAPVDGAEAPPPDPRVTDLERELATNKEYLQSTIEELEAANEELQSSNEELQSSNEELQSTNEELETSKEELQSTNEELATVNDELHNRMSQLSIANDDLQNVLTNGTASMVLVGPDLRIRRFSAAAEKLLNLVPGDAGRPITYLRNVVSARDIDQAASEAIASISVREQRVRCIDSAWYQMKMVPYVTADHMIRGLVVEFVKTSLPSAATSEGVHPLAQQVLSTLPFPIMLVDRQLCLVWANKSFFETFSVGPSVLEGPLSEAWGSASEPPELWEFLDDLMSGRQPRDLLVERPFGRSSDRPMRFSGRVATSDGDRPGLATVFMQDV